MLLLVLGRDATGITLHAADYVFLLARNPPDCGRDACAPRLNPQSAGASGAPETDGGRWVKLGHRKTAASFAGAAVGYWRRS